MGMRTIKLSNNPGEYIRVKSAHGQDSDISVSSPTRLGMTWRALHSHLPQTRWDG